jgi:hypothetical protein
MKLFQYAGCTHWKYYKGKTARQEKKKKVGGGALAGTAVAEYFKDFLMRTSGDNENISKQRFFSWRESLRKKIYDGTSGTL